MALLQVMVVYRRWAPNTLHHTIIEKYLERHVFLKCIVFMYRRTILAKTISIVTDMKVTQE